MQVSSHYKGRVELAFDEKSHIYTARILGFLSDMPSVPVERIADGVTSVLGVINKPALVPWAAKMVADKMAETIKPGVAYDEVQLATLIETAKKAPREKKEKAGDIGHLVHAWIENYIKGEDTDLPVNEQAKSGCKAFIQWVNENHVVFHASEMRVYSREHNFAGTLDFIADVNGKRCLGDIKTGSGIYDEYFFQTAGYDIGLMEEHGDNFDAHIIVNCKKEPDKSGNILEVRMEADQAAIDDNKRAFLAALTLHRRITSMKLKK